MNIRHQAAVLWFQLLACACTAQTSGTARIFPSARLTQHRISEMAAACVTAQAALTGVSGVPRPGETSNTFQQRIKGYIAALQKEELELEPIQRPVTPTNQAGDNSRLWAQISGQAAHLPE